jgi:hypothetical protein
MLMLYYLKLLQRVFLLTVYSVIFFFIIGGGFQQMGYILLQGYALIANKFIEAIMQYGSNLKGVDIGNYRILFPKLYSIRLYNKPSLWDGLSFNTISFVNVNHKVSILGICCFVKLLILFLKNYLCTLKKHPNLFFDWIYKPK